MSVRLRNLLLVLGLVGAGPGSAAAAAAEAGAAGAPPPQSIALRVKVDSAGKVQSSQPLDPNAVPALLNAAQEIARKLQFTPARKNGTATSSETTLSLILALEPRAGGSFGIALQRAQNGPSVVEVGRAQPKVGRDNGGLVVVGADLRSDGTVDMETFKPEKVELRVPSSFAEQRFVDAARASLKNTRFLLDKVDGIEIPSRISVPFRFNGGADRRGRDGEDEGKGKEKKKAPSALPPSLTAVSKIEGIVLPKIDYVAPAK